MTEENTKRSLHLYLATPSDDNDKTRVWEPTGEHMILKNHEGGHLSHAYLGLEDLDLSGVTAGRGRGFASFKIEDGSDVTGRVLVEKWRQAHIEIVFVYREWEQEEGTWENKRTVAVWGYVASDTLKKGESHIGIEVHTAGIGTRNDEIGTDIYWLDCVTGSSSAKGGDLGPRTAHSIAPPAGTPPAGNWGEPFEI